MTRRCVVVQPPSDGVTNCSFVFGADWLFLKKRFKLSSIHSFFYMAVFLYPEENFYYYGESLCFFVYMYYPNPVNVPLLKFLWLKWLVYVAHPAQRVFAENIQKELSFVPNRWQTVIKIHLIIIIIVQSRIFDPCFLKEIFLFISRTYDGKFIFRTAFGFAVDLTISQNFLILYIDDFCSRKITLM